MTVHAPPGGFMKLQTHKKLHVVSGRATQALTRDICHEMGVAVGATALLSGRMPII